MNVVTPIDETALMIRRVFKVDRRTLWNALTQPDAIMQWMGAKMASPAKVETDFRVGGSYQIEMIGNETGEMHKVGGEYLEISEPDRISFSWAWHTTPGRVSRVTYALSAADGGGTTLTLTHERLYDTEARDNHGKGWSATLDSLEEYLAA